MLIRFDRTAAMLVLTSYFKHETKATRGKQRGEEIPPLYFCDQKYFAL